MCAKKLNYAAGDDLMVCSYFWNDLQGPFSGTDER